MVLLLVVCVDSPNPLDRDIHDGHRLQVEDGEAHYANEPMAHFFDITFVGFVEVEQEQYTMLHVERGWIASTATSTRST